MAEIWKAAGAFDIDTFDLEERILSQMLYSTDYIADIEEIYESYVKGGGRELICMAYLSYFADAWLVRNMVVPDLYDIPQTLCHTNDTLNVILSQTPEKMQSSGS